jgi:hypothetical protein
MSDATELERLAEADGALFIRTATGSWAVRDKDGITIAIGCMSRAEAARMYCSARRPAPARSLRRREGPGMGPRRQHRDALQARSRAP